MIDVKVINQESGKKINEYNSPIEPEVGKKVVFVKNEKRTVYVICEVMHVISENISLESSCSFSHLEIIVKQVD